MEETMSLGSDWKNRLDAVSSKKGEVERATKEAVEAKRAYDVVANLSAELAKTKMYRCNVMVLDLDDVKKDFLSSDQKPVTTSNDFFGAGKIVIDFCLQNDLDVYCRMEDYSAYNLGIRHIEVWVTPRGVPFHK